VLDRRELEWDWSGYHFTNRILDYYRFAQNVPIHENTPVFPDTIFQGQLRGSLRLCGVARK